MGQDRRLVGQARVCDAMKVCDRTRRVDLNKKRTCSPEANYGSAVQFFVFAARLEREDHNMKDPIPQNQRARLTPSPSSSGNAFTVRTDVRKCIQTMRRRNP